MNFQFIIPFRNSDLLNSEGDNYFVKQVYETNEIPDKLKNCKNAILTGDAHYIFDHFDTFFSVIEHSKNISMVNLQRSFDLLFVTVDKLGKQLLPFVQNDGTISDSDRNSYLNLTKMTMYLIIEIVKAVDHIAHQTQVDSGQFKKGKKRVDDIESQDWEKKRMKFLIQLYNIMQLPLERLWNPPVAEENFVNLLCDIAYRTLQTPAVKERNIGDTIFQILGTAIKRFNHAISFPIRILQTLRTSENSLAPTARGICLLYDDFGISSVFSVLIKDIVDTLGIDSADSQVSRYFSTFLSELAVTAPKLMIPHLSTLGEELLNLESYVLRNCVLQIMGDVITCELTSEELSDDMKEIRDEFLEDLLSHINDVSAHVRSKVLQIWNHMKEENAVPLAFQHKVLRGAVERLDDKTSTVRKSAILLIKTFLERNPFAAKLTLAELIKRYEEESEKLQKLHQVIVEEQRKVAELDERFEEITPELLPIVEELVAQSTQEHIHTEETCEDMVPRITAFLTEKKYKEAVVLAKRADFVAGNSELRISLQYEEQCAYFMVLLKSYLFISNGCSDSNEEFVTQENTVKFLEDSIDFSKIITKAVPKIQNMLMSKTNSDVFEATDFFTTAFLFGIKGTECGMRHMLYLVWSGDKEKSDAVSNAYKKVLFTTDNQGRAHSVKVVKNLCSFIGDLTYGHYSALEVLIKKWVESEDIDQQIIHVLFEYFTLKVETTENESRQALQLLIMASAAKSSIAVSNIAVIESIGFEDRALKDPRIYAGCLSFLLNSVPSDVKSKFYKRYEEDNTLVQKVVTCFKKFFFHPKIIDFDNISMRTIEFFYQLCQAPDVQCQKIIIAIHSTIKTFLKKIQALQDSQITESSDPRTQESKIKLPVFLISRFLFLIGYATTKEMIFLDIDVYNNMKFRQDLKEEKKNLKKKTHNKRKTVNLDMSASESLKRLSGTAAEPQQEPDEDLVGATAEDSIAELINHICEDELLYSDNGLFTKIYPIVIEICKYPTKYHDVVLQQAACLTLIRFMTVSAKLCEANMPFLMNILNLTTNIKIKCNIVVGLSDLTFRFPNVIEPWTGHFYSTLHETDDELRLTAVKMLSHLILHEMIRVKGQIADLAMCIVDANDEIKNITQQFFKEIANKSNILYNVLPDIISKLSDVNLELEEEKYHTIMRYILGLIQKDRQVESLVEKLCLRFRVTTEERQWRDIAYCLSLLNYNEKTIKKLADNIQHFKDKVQIEQVHQSFKTIISNTSKLAKPELKTAITEFESRLNECFSINDNPDTQSGTENPDSTPRQTQTRKQRSNTRNKTTQRKKKQTKSSSSESESSSGEEERPQKKTTKEGNARSERTKKVTRIIESETSEDEVPVAKKGKTRR